MGHYTRNGTIRCYTPDDTDTSFYVSSDDYLTMEDILLKAREKWGTETELGALRVTAEHIHTDCLGYDQYDPSDYTNYIVVEKKD